MVVLIGLVPNGQLLLAQVDGGTHIAADETLVNWPAFVENIDGGRGIDFAHEMNEALGNRESPRWNERLMSFVKRPQQKCFHPQATSSLLHAVYRRATCLPAVRAALDAGVWRMNGWLETVRLRALSMEQVRELDPQDRAFCNVNTPEEFAQAERWAGESNNE